MCGIFGLLHVNTNTSYKPYFEEEWISLLSNVNHLQRHRGPDEQNYYYDLSKSWGFAHQRLALLELSAAGRQPMKSQSGTSHLVFNGEIYNHFELRKKMQSHSFRGRSDTEVLLEGLELHNVKYLSELDGMYSFGFFDNNRERLLVAVDPAGEKPLYTYWDGKIFAFASEILSLLAIPNISKEQDINFIKQYLTYGYVPSPHTIYKNIRKLSAGSYQWISIANGPEPIQTYWNLLDYCKIQKISYPDAQVQLRELLERSVKKRLEADVPVGCFLSGGLDSSIVSLIASDVIHPKKIQTFSMSFKGNGIPHHYDESVYAQMIANKIKSKHQQVEIDFNRIDSANILKRFGEPFADSSAIPTYYLCKEAADKFKAVLSGDGGDELFGGYLRFRAGLISSELAWLLKPILGVVKFENAPHRSWRGFITRFKSRLNLTTLAQQAAWNSYFDENDFKKYLSIEAENIYSEAKKIEGETRNLSTGQKILYYNFKTYLFDDLLPKVDRMSMAHGLEVRTPFLDRALVEFAFSLPTEYKYNFNQNKKILKDAYEDRLGSDFVNRKKMGFALPIEKFIRAQNMTACIDSLNRKNKDLHWRPLTPELEQTQNYFQKAFLLLSLEANI